jgi:nucleotide-binding universal stress UspA family protein
MIQIKNILAPTDFSVPSRHALKYAAELAKRFQAQLHLVTVVENVIPLVPEAGMLFRAQADQLVEQQKAARHALERVADDPALLALKPRTRVLAGSAHAEILALAKSLEVDLLVVGTHGRTGLSHLFMGSVAEKLVRLATCPVLTVHPEGHQFVRPDQARSDRL